MDGTCPNSGDAVAGKSQYQLQEQGKLCSHYCDQSKFSYIVITHQAGNTPLYLASLKGHVATVRLLIGKMANVNMRDKVVSHVCCKIL